jgi:hypothetical protein
MGTSYLGELPQVSSNWQAYLADTKTSSLIEIKTKLVL